MSKESIFKAILLSDIKSTKENVRTVSTNNVKDRALMLSIQAKGLIQNLSVYKEGEKYYAAAGGRRLAACKMLVKQEMLPTDHRLYCRIIKKAEAMGISLSENHHRERMHPADEFEAFNKLVNQGNSIKSIAEEFGIKQIEVKQRLSLANVAPKIIGWYKKGNIDLETVMAFTLEPDQKKQTELFNAHQGQLNSHTIKRLLTHDSITSDTCLARFVGYREYVAAGGAVTNDIFGKMHYWSDANLVEELATAKMDALVEKHLSDGWKWCEYTFELHAGIPTVTTVDPDDSAVPKALLTKRAKLDSEIERLEALWNNDEEDDIDEDKIEKELEAVEDKASALDSEIESHKTYTDEQKQQAGVFINTDV